MVNLVKTAEQKKDNWFALAPGRLTAAIELTLMIGILEWVLWTDSKRLLSPAARSANIVVLVSVILCLLYRQKPTCWKQGLRDFGLAPSPWWTGLGSLAAFTAAAMAAVASVGWLAGTIGAVDHFARWIGRNIFVELLQQLLLQIMLVPRLRLLIHGDDRPDSIGFAAPLAAAAVFSLLHAPNLPLMGLTFSAGLFWVWWFSRYRNLLALWISHALLAGCVLYCLNGPALRNLRVGINYVLNGQ